MSPEYRAQIRVSFKPELGISDAYSQSLNNTLEGNGFDLDLLRVISMGKIVELVIECPDKRVARRQIKEMVDRFFANPVIERGEIVSLEKLSKARPSKKRK